MPCSSQTSDTGRPSSRWLRRIATFCDAVYCRLRLVFWLMLNSLLWVGRQHLTYWIAAVQFQEGQNTSSRLFSSSSLPSLFSPSSLPPPQSVPAVTRITSAREPMACAYQPTAGVSRSTMARCSQASGVACSMCPPKRRFGFTLRGTQAQSRRAFSIAQVRNNRCSRLLPRTTELPCRCVFHRDTEHPDFPDLCTACDC